MNKPNDSMVSEVKRLVRTGEVTNWNDLALRFNLRVGEARLFFENMHGVTIDPISKQKVKISVTLSRNTHHKLGRIAQMLDISKNEAALLLMERGMDVYLDEMSD